VKLISYRVVNRESWGTYASDGGIIDLGAEFGTTIPTLRDYLAADDAAKAKVAEYVGTGFGGNAGKASDFPASDITLLEPIRNPDKIICVGWNYREHAKEAGIELPDHPTLFARWSNSHVPHENPILLPRESEKFDYEGELAAIIGKPARRVSEADALSYIGGYSIYNDATLRDYQRHSSQYMPGKNFFQSGAFGPCMVTADEIPEPADLTLETRLNGDVVQHTGIDDLIFSIPKLIAYISSFTELVPGDVIATGTPSGAGLGRTPPLWMKDGDTIEVEVSKVGILTNPIKAD
jgi:2-keto-4-pentenoate hydratase/2-oxohepta-3-ene-1,7-dioic acid hydratase in catechol pathway